ncbi:MAG: laccase domain-containing protein, partial [Methylococcales bacterium]|nr:laccase domain-containing protein [Methylococcales bacterium]
NTVAALETTELIAWLGPAIGPDCFEVGAEVRDLFVNKSSAFATGFKQKQQDKYLADIYQLAKIELTSIGVTQVYGGDFCTVTDNNRFYSYRRDGETGRMATLIWRD